MHACKYGLPDPNQKNLLQKLIDREHGYFIPPNEQVWHKAEFLVVAGADTPGKPQDDSGSVGIPQKRAISGARR